MALFKTASDSLALRQILANFLQSIATQATPIKRPYKVTTCVVFSCHTARIAKVVSNKKIFWSSSTPMLICMALMESHSYI